MADSNITPTTLTDGAIDLVSKVVPFGMGAPAAEAAKAKLQEYSASDAKKPSWWDGIQNMLSKIASWLSEMLSKAFSGIFNFIRPNSYAAEKGMNDNIDNSPLFQAVETKLGIAGIAQTAQTESKAAIQKFVNDWTGMPKIGANGDQTAAVANIVELHQALAAKFLPELEKKYPVTSGVTADQINQLAADAAASISGIPKQYALEAASEGFTASRLPASEIKTGYGHMLLTTQKNTDGKEKNTVTAGDIANLTGSADFALPSAAPATPPQQPDEKTREDARKAAEAARNSGATHDHQANHAPTPPQNRSNNTALSFVRK